MKILLINPPYASSDRPRSGEYGLNCFKMQDLPRLFDTLQKIDNRGAKFLLSYGHGLSDFIIPDHWNRINIGVMRHVAGFAKYRVRSKEILIANYKFKQKTLQLDMEHMK